MIRRLLGMVRKDLVRQLRAPVGMGSALAFPLVFAGLLAVTFGTGGDSRVPRVHLLIEDRDGSLLAELLVSAARSEQMAEYFEVEAVGAEGASRIEHDEASALLVIPAGFGEALLKGQPTRLELLRNPAQSILPEIAEQGLFVLADLLTTTSRVLRAPLDRLVALEGKAAPTADEVAAIATGSYAVVERAERLIFPPAITVESVQLTDPAAPSAPAGRSGTGAVFLLVLPGISVWALFLLGDIAMRDILAEGRLGTLRRQLAGPVTAGQVVTGKALFAAVVATLSLVLLAAIAALFARRAVDPLGFVALSGAVVLAVTGWGAFVYGLARTERQGGTVSSILLLLFAFTGGSFIPIESLPDSPRRFAPLSPFYWGSTGYRELIGGGAGLVDVAANIGVLVALGLPMLAAGAWLLERKVRRGAAA